MPELDPDRLLWIVTGVQLNAELGDRPLAYRIEREVKARLTELLPAEADDDGAADPDRPRQPRLAPVVVSDVYYLNSDDAQRGPTISVGGPGVNAVSASLAEQLPTPVAIENTLVVQMDLEVADVRCAVWGMNHLDTVRAVDLFIAKGYLETFVKGVVRKVVEG